MTSCVVNYLVASHLPASWGAQDSRAISALFFAASPGLGPGLARGGTLFVAAELKVSRCW